MLPALLVLIGLLFGGLAQTDPPPQQSFYIDYHMMARPAEIEAVELRQCEDPACAVWAPLDSRPGAEFECSAVTYCSASSDTGFAPYQLMVLRLDDRVLESPVFKTGEGRIILQPGDDRTFFNPYSVTVRPTGLIVVRNPIRESTDYPIGAVLLLIPALLIIQLVETIAASVYLWIRKLPKSRPLGMILLGNLIIIPFVWLRLPPLDWLSDLESFQAWVLAALIASAFEATLLYFTTRKIIPSRDAVLLTVLTNLITFGLPYFTALVT